MISNNLYVNQIFKVGQAKNLDQVFDENGIARNNKYDLCNLGLQDHKKTFILPYQPFQKLKFSGLWRHKKH